MEDDGILVIEPFYGGSHAQLIETMRLDPIIGPKLTVCSLPAKKWHWRARTSALQLFETIPQGTNYRILFSSSVLNLAELLALRPDLAGLWKMVYFHENQLVYPVRKYQDRDFHYGYAQIMTCLVADAVVFNSAYNMESFLSSISQHLKLIPDNRPKNIEAKIRPKCSVAYFPINFQNDKEIYSRRSNSQESHDGVSLDTLSCPTGEDNKQCDESERTQLPVGEDQFKSKEARMKRHIEETTFPSLCRSGGDCDHSGDGVAGSKMCKSKMCKSKMCNSVSEQTPEANTCQLRVRDTPSQHQSRLHIVWPHRWEHDKNPEAFFQTLFDLHDNGFDFCVSVIGESCSEIPEVFNTAKERLSDRIQAWGFQTRDNYRQILDSAHVAVSTANHEFFGVAMLEATFRGCFPLCPKRLAYPEIYPDDCLYSTQAQLLKRLKKFCQRPDKIPIPKIDVEKYSWRSLQSVYMKLLKIKS